MEIIRWFWTKKKHLLKQVCKLVRAQNFAVFREILGSQLKLDIFVLMVPLTDLAIAVLVLLVCLIWKRYFRQDELSEKNSILAAKKDELDAASRQWKSRVEQSDAVNFSVAGRMQQKTEVPTINISISGPDNVKRTPQPKKFRGKGGEFFYPSVCFNILKWV